LAADDKYGLPLGDFFIDSHVVDVIRNNAVLINRFLPGCRIRHEKTRPQSLERLEESSAQDRPLPDGSVFVHILLLDTGPGGTHVQAVRLGSIRDQKTAARTIQ
jgi:hypothetical protein